MHVINEYFVSNKLVMYLFMSLFVYINCVNIIEGVGLECQAVGMYWLHTQYAANIN